MRFPRGSKTATQLKLLFTSTLISAVATQTGMRIVITAEILATQFSKLHSDFLKSESGMRIACNTHTLQYVSEGKELTLNSVFGEQGRSA